MKAHLTVSPLRETLEKTTHLLVIQKPKDQLLQILPQGNTSDSPPDLGDNFEKRVQNLVKAREETVTTPPPEESEQTNATLPSDNTSTKGVSEGPSIPKEPPPHREDSPANYPPKDHPEAPLNAEDGSVVPLTNKTQHVPPDDPFSRFWSGHTADTSDKNQRRPRWLTGKPERRLSIDLEELDKQDPRPYRYVLRRA